METVIRITPITRSLIKVAPILRNPEIVVETTITRLSSKVTTITRELILNTKILQ